MNKRSKILKNVLLTKPVQLDRGYQWIEIETEEGGRFLNVKETILSCLVDFVGKRVDVVFDEVYQTTSNKKELVICWNLVYIKEHEYTPN